MGHRMTRGELVAGCRRAGDETRTSDGVDGFFDALGECMRASWCHEQSVVAAVYDLRQAPHCRRDDRYPQGECLHDRYRQSFMV